MAITDEAAEALFFSIICKPDHKPIFLQFSPNENHRNGCWRKNLRILALLTISSPEIIFSRPHRILVMVLKKIRHSSRTQKGKQKEGAKRFLSTYYL